MKSLMIGTLSLALSLPALAAPTPVASAAAEKFGPIVRLNYTPVARVAPRGGYRPGYGYRGYPYRGGYWHGRYPYYGYRYPYWGGGYWGGYYGYPYAAAALALTVPLAYGAGYYAAAPGYGYGYYAAPQGYYNGRIVAETGPARVGTGGSVSRSVQSALASHGYDPGAVDGRFGPQSQQAMAQFQQANGLKVTGLIDSSSLKALGLR